MDKNVRITKSGISNRNIEGFHQVLVEIHQGGDFFCILKFHLPRGKQVDRIHGWYLDALYKTKLVAGGRGIIKLTTIMIVITFVHH
ncbi:hypothetical protein PRUPE_4G245000 [Prunus persica]|uniref:Uncharacterized protein n=1 Tax=Prunus persica TaxID=3760 RepID=A0A251PQF3_PRUPE|nr:hypothetical protein PRUPE_4G245000 [Prunus persica]